MRKAEAAMNDDFELAIVYKKKIAEHEKDLISADQFDREWWNNRPVLTMQELLLRLIDLQKWLPNY
jgi:hypothetical protein